MSEDNADIEVEVDVDLGSLFDFLENLDWDRAHKDTNEQVKFYIDLMKRASVSEAHEDLINKYVRHKVLGKPKPERPN